MTDVLFILSLFLLMATVVTQGLKVKPRTAEIVVALGVVTVYLFLFGRMSFATERGHMLEYGVVAIFILEALKERKSQGRHVPVPGLLAIGATTLIGILDESVQLFMPTRVFDFRDIGFNALAALMAVGTSLALAWTRREGGKLFSKK